MDESMVSTGTIADAVRELVASDDEAARAYLKESFLAQAMLALFYARRDAGLTQAQLAARLSTKQSSVARLERDLAGSVTLRRYVEVALACGVMPLDLSLVPVEQLKQYVAHDPDAEKTQAALDAWAVSQPIAPLSVSATLQTAVPVSSNTGQVNRSGPMESISHNEGKVVPGPQEPMLQLNGSQHGQLGVLAA